MEVVEAAVETVPEATRPRRPWGRIARTGAVIAALVAGAGAALYAVDQARREDTPEQFAQLAGNLCTPMLPSDVTVVRPSDAEVVVNLKHRREVNRDVSRTCRTLATLADEDLAVLDGFRAIDERRETAAPLVGAAALTAVGIFAHSGDATQVGAEHAFDELRRLGQTWVEFCALRNRLTANQIELALLAPRFSGPVCATCLVTGAFDEPGLIFGPDQHTLSLTNVSGAALHDCVVDVRLVDEDGESYRNVRFVSTWPMGQAVCARFERGLFSETPRKVKRIFVTVWAREQSSATLTMKRGLFGW